jgi:hypothetical protein
MVLQLIVRRRTQARQRRVRRVVDNCAPAPPGARLVRRIPRKRAGKPLIWLPATAAHPRGKHPTAHSRISCNSTRVGHHGKGQRSPSRAASPRFQRAPESGYALRFSERLGSHALTSSGSAPAFGRSHAGTARESCVGRDDLAPDLQKRFRSRTQKPARGPKSRRSLKRGTKGGLKSEVQHLIA